MQKVHVSMAKPISPGLSNCQKCTLKKLNIKNQKMELT